MKHFFFQHKWCIAILTMVGVLLMLFFLDPSRYVLMPKCPFKLITGWSCPGCGIQRCLYALMHGRWSEALHYNYFLVYSLPYFLTVVYTEWGTKGIRQQRFKRIFEGREAVTLYCVLFIVWGIVRNVLAL